MKFPKELYIKNQYDHFASKTIGVCKKARVKIEFVKRIKTLEDLNDIETLAKMSGQKIEKEGNTFSTHEIGQYVILHSVEKSTMLYLTELNSARFHWWESYHDYDCEYALYVVTEKDIPNPKRKDIDMKIINTKNLKDNIIKNSKYITYLTKDSVYLKADELRKLIKEELKETGFELCDDFYIRIEYN